MMSLKKLIDWNLKLLISVQKYGNKIMNEIYYKNEIDTSLTFKNSILSFGQVFNLDQN